MRILIIEDEQKNSRSNSKQTKKENYVVDTYKDGEEGPDNALNKHI